MEPTYVIIAVLVSYLLGSIPTSVWVGKIFYGIDVRQCGSGNAGTTNTFRVLGAKAAIPVFIIDVLKAYAAAQLVHFFPCLPHTPNYVNLQLLFGIVAVIGHIFPIYVGFKGGKGVASLLGVTLAIVPMSALLAFSVFVVVLLISHYVSLGSMIAGCSFPIFVIFVERTSIVSLQVFSILFAILLLVTHKENILRLWHGEEKKIF
ncbi:MAG: glycerol-3-phosphate 1-O-acyltransferase PlsY [Bacteroidales bacterium]|nr:glycerol-3-phosphate 1-O-acyltransferase PlsY [Bacteroidales bacterium]